MKFYSLFYSLKVWLSSVLLAPLIYNIIQLMFNSAHFDLMPAIELYPVIVFFELILSFVAWLLFWVVIEVTGALLRDLLMRKLFIFIVATFLSGGISFMFFTPETAFSFDNIIFNLTLCNCFCVGFGCWFFKLGPKVVSDKNIINA